MEETGFYEHFAKGLSLDDFPPVVKVFSAPEYCNVYSNMVGLDRLSVFLTRM